MGTKYDAVVTGSGESVQSDHARETEQPIDLPPQPLAETRSLTPEQKVTRLEVQDDLNLPALAWSIDEEGDSIVELYGFPNASIMADGHTREEALHKLGDILFHHFNDACTEPEQHLKPQPSLTPADLIALRELRDEMRNMVTASAMAGSFILADVVNRWADRLDVLITRLSSETEQEICQTCGRHPCTYQGRP